MDYHKEIIDALTDVCERAKKMDKMKAIVLARKLHRKLNITKDLMMLGNVQRRFIKCQQKK